MTEQTTIALLGAEKQAAVSAALAWPERRFLFVSDAPVLDGWDLPNVEFLAASPQELPRLLTRKRTNWLPLCARWITPQLHFPSNGAGTFQLSRVMRYLQSMFGEAVLPVLDVPVPKTRCIVKGNHWHRPDATLISDDLSLQEISDPHHCGLVYQPHWPWQRQLLATGWRTQRSLYLALLHIHSEVCARDDVLGAGQTIAHAQVAEMTVSMLEVLDHYGFFTFNWLEMGDQVRLSSFRPVPRGVFRTFRRAGFDPFAPAGAPGVRVAPVNLKFVTDITYTSYRPLAA